MKVVIEKETFDKVVSVLGNMPYVQVAGLLNEIRSNMEVVEEDASAEDSSDS